MFFKPLYSQRKKKTSIVITYYAFTGLFLFYSGKC